MDGITNSIDMSLGELWELVMDRRPGVLRFMGHKDLDMTEWLNWTECEWAASNQWGHE